MLSQVREVLILHNYCFSNKKNSFYFAPILFLFFWSFTSYSQITTIDFETSGNGYTPSATAGSGFTDVFNRSNPNIGGNSTYMWSVEDLPLTNPYIDLDQIDITGSTGFTFAIDRKSVV